MKQHHISLLMKKLPGGSFTFLILQVTFDIREYKKISPFSYTGLLEGSPVADPLTREPLSG
jgi:hypothetical protein